MNVLDLNTDVQKVFLGYLTHKEKVVFLSLSKKALHIAPIVDESFKDKIEGRAAIQKLKNWTFAKIVLGVIILPVSMIVLANIVHSVTTAILASFLLGLIGFGLIFFLKNSINELNVIDSVERKFNARKEKNLFLREIDEKKLFPNGLDFKRQRINRSNAAVETKLENPARGTFIFNYKNHKYVFEAMYCFDNYYGGTDLWYKRILKVCDGVNENTKQTHIYSHCFFGDDKFKVNSIKYADGKLVLEMDSPLCPREDYHSEQRFIELELS